jgi:hypothetical protein
MPQDKDKQHGGKRPGAGRPRKTNPKTSVFSCAVTAEELEILRRTNASEWAREVLLKAAKKLTT